jgi:hypothetical protein
MGSEGVILLSRRRCRQIPPVNRLVHNPVARESVRLRRDDSDGLVKTGLPHPQKRQRLQILEDLSGQLFPPNLAYAIRSQTAAPPQ